MKTRLGGFEELVLLAVATLDEEGYGVTIHEQLERSTGHTLSIGAVYAALDRLERKKLLRSRTGQATGVRGGRRKRLYATTSGGRTALLEMQRIRDALRGSVAPGVS